MDEFLKKLVEEYTKDNNKEYNLLKKEFIKKMNTNEILTPNEFISLCYLNDNAYYKVKEFINSCTNEYKCLLGYKLYQNLTISIRLYTFSDLNNSEINLNDKDFLKNEANLFFYLFSCFSVLSHNFNYSNFLIAKPGSFKYGESNELLIRCIVFVETVLEIFSDLPINIKYFYRTMCLEEIKRNKISENVIFEPWDEEYKEDEDFDFGEE